MAFSKTFEGELNSLFRQRTYWLRQQLGTTGAGKPPHFGRKKVTQGISKLQEIASKALSQKLAKVAFEEHVKLKKNYRIKGRGPADKKVKFEKWFAAFERRKGLVYVFWRNNKQCVYVGRTGSHGSRPSSHFDKYWFSCVTRVTILDVKNKSQIPKLECLAIHHFRPKRNKNRAATKRWTKACPLCTTHKYIENELRDVFRFR